MSGLCWDETDREEITRNWLPAGCWTLDLGGITFRSLSNVKMLQADNKNNLRIPPVIGNDDGLVHAT